MKGVKRVLIPFLAAIMIVLCLSGFAACGEQKAHGFELKTGESVEITVADGEQVDDVMYWATGDETVAVIENDFFLVGMAPGSTKLYGMMGDDTISLEHDVTVTAYSLEGKFKEPGFYAVKSQEITLGKEYTEKWGIPVNAMSGNQLSPWQKCMIWYPEELETSEKQYPVIVFGSGSDSTYATAFVPSMLQHFASYGFIVVGNDEIADGLGKAIAGCISFLLDANKDEESFLNGKIDETAIGVLGGSQGGAGALNACCNFGEISEKIAAVCSWSAPGMTLGRAIKWYADDFSFNKISAACFMLAGTGTIDSELIIPLREMQDNYNNCNSSPFVVKARINYSDHTDYEPAKGYMTAWFAYRLQNDPEAAKIFEGSTAEIKNNARWVDVEIKEN